MHNQRGRVQETVDMSKRKDAAALARIRALATERNLPVLHFSKHILNELSGQRPHQGVMADCEALPYEALGGGPDAHDVMRNWRGIGAPIWLALDQVGDPVRLALYKCVSLYG